MSHISITTDMEVLQTALGYINNDKEVRYNPTIDTCVIDMTLIGNVGKTLNDFFRTMYKKEVVDFLQINNERGNLEQKIRPLTIGAINRLASISGIDKGDIQSKCKLIENVIDDGFVLNGEKIQLHYRFVATDPYIVPALIDFEAMQHKLQFSDLEFITLLLESLFSDVTPRQIKKTKGKLKLPYDKQSFLESPFVSLLGALVLNANAGTKADNYYEIGTGFIDLFESHYFHGDTNLYQMFVYRLRASFSLAIQYFIKQNAIFTPYSKATAVMGRTNYPFIFPDTDEIAIQISSTKGASSPQAQAEQMRLLRGLRCSTNMNAMQDLPEMLCFDYVKCTLQMNDKLGYEESVTEHPRKALKQVIQHLERTDSYRNQPNFKPFNLGALNKSATKRILEGDLSRTSTTLNRYQNQLPEELLNELRLYSKTQGNAQKMQYLNHFIDFIIEYNSKESEQLTSVEQMEVYHFYHPLHSEEFSFWRYLENHSNFGSPQSKKTVWSQVRLALTHIFNAKKRQGSTKAVPMPPSQDIYKDAAGKRTTTSRRSMPSDLYDICLEVLTESDYEFVRDRFPSFTVTLYNYMTATNETVFMPNAARILHILMILPARTHQGRWLDEGLLDEKIWDLDRQKYVINTASTANFVYPDGKTHNEKFGKTAFIQSEQQEGVDELSLYFNTNKTKGYTLQKKGHTGYSVPWVVDSGIENVDAVLDIIKKQKAFNDKYSPKHLIPVRTVDEDAGKYSQAVFEQLPRFIPLFRDVSSPKASIITPDMGTIYLPPTHAIVRKVFIEVLKEAEVRYKRKNPHHAKSKIAFAEDGTPLFDLHSLRVYGITELLNSGLDKDIVKLLVGHNTSIMTMYYRKIGEKEYKKALLEAQRKSGISIANEKDALESGINNINWIDNAALVEDFSLFPPDFSKGGHPRFMKGGVCMNFDCQDGGVIVKAGQNGTDIPSLTSVKGGAFRCGNCRYWRSSPRFIAEQIYYLNECATEVKVLTDERFKIYEQINDAYDNLEDPEFVIARLNDKADQRTELLCHRVTELRRRQKMLQASLEQMEIENSTMPVLMNDQKYCVEPTYESLNMLDAAMELSMQAAMLGLDPSESEVHVNNLDQFLNKIFNEASVSNPLLYIPSNEVKRAAVLFAAVRTKELLGEDITDEAFADPRLLFEDPTKASKLIEGLKRLDKSFSTSAAGIEYEN
ncbi:hypothetical protein DC904_03580 [Vibrio parahaemolyticus]|uniref:VPA1269 family protein n=3 Tax=Vibrio harveyi group TaxID=717610 RepID=UPI000940BC40|nr:VPA1269 family protein [Vibrio antiquarius]EGR3000161.1 hypothetical protein [Vibrio parahaemolyticus]EGR3219789.1 hypothetical protein [Vibrio parahaemolyticus]OKQ14080.1 hypothetical protein H058_07340 [Vibrio antiquarius]